MTTTEAGSTRYEAMTKAELDDLARRRDLPGRSQLTKAQLVEALRNADIGPDALELLTAQHGSIRELFTRVRSRPGDTSTDRLHDVRELASTLVKHAEIEELVFYPAVRQALEDEDLVDESLEEHHVAELLLWELEKLPADASRYDAKVTVLEENVLHHLEEEETELFPRVAERLDERERRELGAAMVRAWDIAPSRPHPASPSTPPGNWLLGMVATGQDAVVGILKLVKRQVFRR